MMFIAWRTFVFASLAGYICGVLYACALDTAPTFHVPPHQVVTVVDDDCGPPCCSREFDTGVPAEHEGCE